jgi:hypothetical protein
MQSALQRSTQNHPEKIENVALVSDNNINTAPNLIVTAQKT